MNFQLKKIYTTHIAIKYNPPTIAIFYKIKETDKKQRVYCIELNGLVNLTSVD